MTASTPPRTADHVLSAQQETRVRTRLVADLQEARDLQDKLRKNIADGIESRRGSSNDEVDDPEGANTAFEGAQAHAMLQHTQRHALEISDALVRLDAGSYGLCTNCGVAIATGRLEARPSTAFCISCAS